LFAAEVLAEVRRLGLETPVEASFIAAPAATARAGLT
jgi:hypothetical protein